MKLRHHVSAKLFFVGLMLCATLILLFAVQLQEAASQHDYSDGQALFNPVSGQ